MKYIAMCRPLVGLGFGLCLWGMGSPVARAAQINFVEGVAVFEAEEYTNNIPRTNRIWEIQTSPSGFSGAGFMVVTNGPDANSNITANVATSSPELQYDLNMPGAGPYYVWIAAYCGSGTEDSVHLGVDGVVNGSQMTFALYNAWAWGGSARTITVASAGAHVFSLWMREDGTRIDRVAISTNAAFQPRAGNAWHIPDNIEPVIGLMRFPLAAIYSNTAVTVYCGNQFQGGTNAGNQVTGDSFLYYKHATGVVWTAVAMNFAAESGNNKYHTATIPAGFKAGDVVQYYFKIPYDNFLPTYLATSNGVGFATEYENRARTNPFSFTVLDPASQLYPSPDDWRNENIYFLMTDRFFDGDPSNNSADPFSGYDPANATRLHGGDLKGIEKKLDYIKALGATAIWITPIPQNTTNRAYHGYSAYDFYKLAPQLGSTNDFKGMTSAAHARGIKVVLDIVVNHQGRIIDSGDAGFPAYNSSGNYNLRWTDNAIQYPPPFNQFSSFHAYGDVNTYVDPNQILGDLRGLDDLKTESTYVRTNMAKIYSHWIQAADLDGFRIDTVKHVEMGFWQYFCPAIRAFAQTVGKTNFFHFGEVFDGADSKCGSYTGTQAGGPFALESVVDYPLYNKINSAIATASGNTKQIEDHYDALAANYDASSRDRLVTFLDNHDNPRFLSGGLANNDLNRLKLGLAFLYTSRGIPCLYYGTEQHFNGGNDPDNREDMFDGQFEQGPSLGDNFDMTKAGFLLVAQLNNFRRVYPALRTGTHVNRWNNPSGPGLFAYQRRLGTQEVMVVLNTAGSMQTLTNRSTLYAPGTVLVNLFNTNESIVVTAATSTPPISVGGTAYKMFIARSQWKPLDPVVTNQSPAHGVGGVNVLNPLVLRFSKPMDTTSVQAAFSVVPSVGGSFVWNAARTEMTFTPSGLGFTALSTNVVRLETNAVDAVDGRPFFAPFESFFVTAASSVTDQVPPSVNIVAPLMSSTLSGSILVSGSATDDVQLAKVEFRLDGGNWVSVSGTSSWSIALNTVNFLNGTHALSARASDSSGNLSTNASVSVRFFNAPTAYVQRIAPGSPSDVTNCDANIWVADRTYTLGGFGNYAFGSFGSPGGVAGMSGNVISGVCASGQALYQSERYGSASVSAFGYLFDCPEGVYEVTVLETETTFGAPNMRVFDLNIEGQQALSFFDIYAAVGGMNIPVDLVFTTEVTDAQLELQFVSQVENARTSGIQVRRIGEMDTDGDGIPNWWSLGYFDHATGQDGDQSQAGDDPDGDEFSNLLEYIAGTDPLDSASHLHVSEIALDHVAVPSVSGRQYDVESTTDDVWSVVVSNQPGTGALLVLPTTNEAPMQWYRARVRLAPQ